MSSQTPLLRRLFRCLLPDALSRLPPPRCLPNQEELLRLTLGSSWLKLYASNVSCALRSLYVGCLGGRGVSPTGKSFRFVSFVLACMCAVWLPSGTRTQKSRPTLFLFPFGPGSFSFSRPPTPQISYPTLVGLIGSQIAT